jgi:hemerythrin-like domain-containing protein
MDELTSEHVLARRTVASLVEAEARYLAGDQAARDTVTDALATLAGLYPGHIRKEDKVFFPAAMKYLDRSEMDAMLAEMARFDQNMIHEKYRKVVEEWV